MFLEFHVANLPPELSLEQLQDFFAQYGKISDLKFLVRKDGISYGTAYLKLDIGGERGGEAYQKFLEETNQTYVYDHRLFVTPSKPAKMKMLTPEMTQMIKDITTKLDEDDTVPRYQIQRLVQFCEPHVVHRILEETLEIEANGGLLVNDRSRRRTIGGVFFHLVRLRLSGHLQRVVLINPTTRIKPLEDATPKPKKEKIAKEKPAPKAKPMLPKAPKAKDQAKRPIKLPTPPKKVAPAPTSDPVALRQATEELLELRKAYAAAQEQLESLKTLPSADRKSGLFSATREVVNIQKQMTALIKQYPELSDV